MATNLEQVTEYLDDEHVKYAVENGNRVVFVPFGEFTVRIFIVEDGEGLGFQVPNVFNLAQSKHREQVLAWMSHRVYRIKIGHFGYDPSDGEVDIGHFLPIEDGELTKTVFMRCLMTVSAVAHREVGTLRQLAFTGEAQDDEWGGGFCGRLTTAGLQNRDIHDASGEPQLPFDSAA